LYDKFECNFGKVIDNNIGRDSEKGSSVGTPSVQGKRSRSGSGDSTAIADAVSSGLATEAQMDALKFLAQNGSQEDREEAMSMIRQKAGLPPRVVGRNR
jgi:hypothetical protein